MPNDESLKLINLWKNFNNMPTKTTILDRIIEMEKAARNEHIQRAITEATSKDHINAKKIEAKPVVPHVELLTWVKEATGKGKNLDIQL